MRTFVFIFIAFVLLSTSGCKKDNISINQPRSSEVLSKSTSTTKTLKYGKMTDIDGNVYKTIQIGNQIWMAENLRVTKFRNGDPIFNITDQSDWGSIKRPGYCYYNNDSASNNMLNGKLYNYFAVADPRGIAPKGWHIPKLYEWFQLIDYLGGTISAGKKMKSTFGWYNNGNGTNEIGFNAYPSGSRYDAFYGLSEYTTWWTSTEDMLTIYLIGIDYFSDKCSEGWTPYPEFGFSIRCIKD